MLLYAAPQNFRGQGEPNGGDREAGPGAVGQTVPLLVRQGRANAPTSPGADLPARVDLTAW